MKTNNWSLICSIYVRKLSVFYTALNVLYINFVIVKILDDLTFIVCSLIEY